MRIITLLTDFGLKDGNAAILKGIILQISPNAQIVDISHVIQPQNILEAALILFHAGIHFPPDTIHIIVVDPGVGTMRRPIAAKIGTQYFVCPDNGVLTMFLNRADDKKDIQCIHLTNSQYWLPEISHVFHGRDIFAPVAAHISMGIKLKELGKPVFDLINIDIPTPQKSLNAIRGMILHIDHFGNIITNISKSHLEEIDRAKLLIKICGIELKGLFNTFGDSCNGEIIALLGSPNYLMVSMVNGNAARTLGGTVGQPVEVFY
jgi:S-adenosyl-L-methionine hydrolase (adenosine-forming)